MKDKIKSSVAPKSDIVDRGKSCIRSFFVGGAWVAQVVKHPTLDFSSGHDLTVREFEPPWWALC